MNKYNFKKIYHKDDVNTTFRYPFEVSKDVEMIEVFIEIKQDEKPVDFKDRRPDPICVGIEYDGFIRSWNCAHKEYLVLRREFGLPGSIPREIESGEWNLVIFPRTKNQIIEVEVNVDVVITPKRFRYVKGDTHLHTYHSDGSISIDRHVDMCKESGLDYMFITDHNISSANYSLPKDKGILVLPGVEYGLEAGHMNILGQTTSVPDFTWDKDNKCYYDVIEHVKESPAGVGMNHPFCNDSPWLLDKNMDFDWVEVWNGMWRPVNSKAVRWWNKELCKGRRIAAVGGSDNHHDNDPVIKPGVPCTHAYVDELAGQKIVDALKNGHCYITLLPSEPEFHMSTKNNIMGDLTDDSEVSIQIEGLMQGDCVYIITDKLETEYVQDSDTFNKRFKREDEKFVRVEVRRKLNANAMIEFLDYEAWITILLSNPIYFKQ